MRRPLSLITLKERSVEAARVKVTKRRVERIEITMLMRRLGWSLLFFVGFVLKANAPGPALLLFFCSTVGTNIVICRLIAYVNERWNRSAL